MDPYYPTLKRLKKNGYGDLKYYGNGDEYKEIPDNQASLYIEQGPPSFYIKYLKWPFMPDDEHGIPASFRYFTSDIGNNRIAILQGWDDYNNLCGLPWDLNFNNQIFENSNEEYLASNIMIFDNTSFLGNNNLLFRANKKILFKQGMTISSENNNHIRFEAKNPCDYLKKSSSYSSKSSNSNFSGNVDIIEPFIKTRKKDSLSLNPTLTKEMLIFPNPNKGEFTIQSINTMYKTIYLYSTFGEKIECRISSQNANKVVVKVMDDYKGVAILEICLKDKTIKQKLIIQ